MTFLINHQQDPIPYLFLLGTISSCNRSKSVLDTFLQAFSRRHVLKHTGGESKEKGLFCFGRLYHKKTRNLTTNKTGYWLKDKPFVMHNFVSPKTRPSPRVLSSFKIQSLITRSNKTAYNRSVVIE